MQVVSTHPSDHRHTNAMKLALANIEAPGWAVVFGDRRDMLEAALKLHYDGVKLVHVGGGDTPHGYYHAHPDHMTRDAITMLSHVHCVANEFAFDNLHHILGRAQDFKEWVYITGSPGLDEVVAYAKTLDPDRKREGVFEWFPEVELHTVWARHVGLGHLIATEASQPTGCYEATNAPRLSPQEFLHKLAHCALFRSNSSAALYEAPILGTPVELVGDRQTGRRGPYHHPEGRACEAIRKVIEDVCVQHPN